MANPTVRVGFLGDASQLARESRRAQDSLDGVSRHAHTTSTALGTALGTVAGRGIGAIAGAAKNAVGSVAGMASASINAASDMNESLSKSQAVFGSSADTVKAWADDNTKNILLTKQSALEGAATFGNLFVALGLGKPAAADLSTSLVGLAQDLSSFNNVGTDDALLALRSGLVGEVEPLRKFGVNLSQARIEAEAFALGIAKPVKNAAAIKAAHNSVAAATANVAKVEKEHGKGTLAAAQARDGLARANANLTKSMAGQKVQLTAAQKAQAAYSIILKDTKTAQGDAARTQDGYANSTKILHKNIGDLEVTIGQKLLPHALDLTHALSGLVEGFDKGTGAGGRLRDDLADLGQTAGGIGEDLKPVLGVARWFVEHPNVFKGAAEGLALYWVAAKAAFLWNVKLAPSLVGVGAGEVAVADASAGAVGGIEAVGGAAHLAFPEVAALAGAVLGAYEAFKYLKGLDNSDIPNFVNSPGYSDYDAANDPNSSLYTDPIGMDGKPYRVIPKGKPNTPDDYAAKAGRGKTAVAQSIVSDAAKTAAVQKTATDTVIGAQNYAADQASAAAKKKSDAADALAKATQKLQDALQNRLDTAKGIRDNLVSSNSIIREGVSFTAKDLLARFNVTVAKVKRFQTAISALVHKGFSQEIVQQAAQAGIGSLGAVEGLAHANATQIRQINAAQTAIDRAAGGTGDRVASQIVVKIDNKLLIGNKELQLLATEVRRQNVSGSRNGSLLAS